MYMYVPVVHMHTTCIVVCQSFCFSRCIHTHCSYIAYRYTCICIMCLLCRWHSFNRNQPSDTCTEVSWKWRRYNICMDLPLHFLSLILLLPPSPIQNADLDSLYAVPIENKHNQEYVSHIKYLLLWICWWNVGVLFVGRHSWKLYTYKHAQLMKYSQLFVVSSLGIIMLHVFTGLTCRAGCWTWSTRLVSSVDSRCSIIVLSTERTWLSHSLQHSSSKACL